MSNDGIVKLTVKGNIESFISDFSSNLEENLNTVWMKKFKNTFDILSKELYYGKKSCEITSQDQNHITFIFNYLKGFPLETIKFLSMTYPNLKFAMSLFEDSLIRSRTVLQDNKYRSFLDDVKCPDDFQAAYAWAYEFVKTHDEWVATI